MEHHIWMRKSSEVREARGSKRLRVFRWMCSRCGSKVKTYAPGARAEEYDSHRPSNHTLKGARIKKDCDLVMVKLTLEE